MVMCLFVLTYLLISALLVWLAAILFGHWGIAIAPLLISLGMFLDGFILGPVEKIAELLDSDPTPHSPLPTPHTTRSTRSTQEHPAVAPKTRASRPGLAPARLHGFCGGLSWWIKTGCLYAAPCWAIWIVLTH